MREHQRLRGRLSGGCESAKVPGWGSQTYIHVLKKAGRQSGIEVLAERFVFLFIPLSGRWWGAFLCPSQGLPPLCVCTPLLRNTHSCRGGVPSVWPPLN